MAQLFQIGNILPPLHTSPDALEELYFYSVTQGYLFHPLPANHRLPLCDHTVQEFIISLI